MQLFEDNNLFKKNALEKAIGIQWTELLYDLFNSPEIINLSTELKKLRKQTTVYPSQELLFKPFELAPGDIKLIIISHNPYPSNINDGLGLSSFIPTKGNKAFFKSINRTDSCMYDLHSQGLFSINYIWTCENNNPKAHENLGWEIFTKELIKKISFIPKYKIFLWLGASNDMKKVKKQVVKSKFNHHLFRESLFLKYKDEWDHKDVFNEINKLLIENGREPIRFV